MSVPGSNLLAEALGIIASQSVIYYRFASRATNAIGLDLPTYDEPEEVFGSFQPVPRNLYQSLGLDFEKDYWNFYSITQMNGVSRDTSGDKIVYNGKTYQALSANDWHSVDGWQGMLFIEVAE